MTPAESEEPRDTTRDTGRDTGRDTEPGVVPGAVPDGPGDTVADPPPADAPANPASPAAPATPGPPPRAARGRVELPTDVDAAFAAIVAGWTDDTPRWPTDGPGPDGPAGPATGELSSGVGLATPPSGEPAVRPRPPSRPPSGAGDTAVPDGSRGATPPRGPRDHEPPAVDEHFVPPEPPPLPRLGMSSLLGLLLLVVGVVLLAVPGIVGASVGLGIVPGLLAMTAGLGWLVLGMRRPSERDGDDRDEHGEL